MTGDRVSSTGSKSQRTPNRYYRPPTLQDLELDDEGVGTVGSYQFRTQQRCSVLKKGDDLDTRLSEDTRP